MKITFATIDAKETLLVGINYEHPYNQNNYKVLQQAEKEYLEKLDALQKEICQKYEPQLQEKGEPVTSEVYEKSYQSFLDRYKLYGHLYYT
jgi:hypothetical protein